MHQWSRSPWVGGNGLSLIQHQAITQTDTDLLSELKWNRNKLLWNLNQITDIIFQKNSFEKVACKMAAILFRSHCVKRFSLDTKAWLCNSWMLSFHPGWSPERRQLCRYPANMFRVDSRLAPSQWETALLCNAVSHWLSASLESALYVGDIGRDMSDFWDEEYLSRIVIYTTCGWLTLKYLDHLFIF